MKIIYQLLLSFLFLTSGVVAAMDNQGQSLMDAIQNGNLAQVQNLVKANPYLAYQEVNTSTPLRLARQLASTQPDRNNAQAIEDTVIAFAFSDPALYYVVIEKSQGSLNDFVNNMRQFIEWPYVIRSLILYCVKAMGDRAAEIDQLMHYIPPQGVYPSAGNYPRDLFSTDAWLLPTLIEKFPYGADNYKENGSTTLPEWVTWCLERGAPVDGKDTAGSTALLLAVRGENVRGGDDGYLDIVKILLQYHANPHENSRGGTPMLLAEKKAREKKTQTPANIAILRVLKGEPETGTATPAAGNKSFGINISKLFTSYKTWAALACMYLGVKCYQRVTSGYAAKHEKNVIVNEAGTDISVTDENKNATHIHTGEDNVLELPKFEGSLTVRFQDASKNTSKDLVIDLDRYADDDYHMNIIIRPTKWFERFFVRSPLYYSVTWKRKAAPQKSTHEAVHETV